MEPSTLEAEIHEDITTIGDVGHLSPFNVKTESVLMDYTNDFPWKPKEEDFFRLDEPMVCRITDDPCDRHTFRACDTSPSFGKGQQPDPIVWPTELAVDRGDSLNDQPDRKPDIFYSNSLVKEESVTTPNDRRSDTPDQFELEKIGRPRVFTPVKDLNEQFRVEWDLYDDDSDNVDISSVLEENDNSNVENKREEDLVYVELVVDLPAHLAEKWTDKFPRQCTDSENSKVRICVGEHMDTPDTNRQYQQESILGSGRPVKKNVKSTTVTVHQCILCPRSFRDKTNLKIHLLSHTKERPHECNICGVRIRHNLEEHMRNVHQSRDEKKFKCKICPLAFQKSAGLRRHQSSHSEDKPHECNICHSRFKFRGNLTRHMDNHRREEKGSEFACNQCDQNFTSQFSLNIHLRIHSGEKPFKCDVCEKRFHRRDLLTLHQKRHTDPNGERRFVCKICGAGFYLRTQLLNHMTEHNGGELFNCHLCDKSYSLKGSLTTHMKRHSGKKHVCQICNKVLSAKSCLKTHMELKHWKHRT